MKYIKACSIVFIILLSSSCSTDSDGTSNTSKDALIGRWFRESTESGSGGVTDDSASCLITEIARIAYTVSDFTGDNCTQRVNSVCSTYSVIAFDIFLNGNDEIDFKIVELNETTLKLRIFNDELDEGNALDTITYSKLE